MIALDAALLVAAGLGFVLVIFGLSGFRYIPNDRIGIVEKRWSLRGSVKSGLIALNDEAGYQPDVLRGGVHYLMPLQYRVHSMPLVTIPQGKIGYIFARDGEPLAPTQALASNIRTSSFLDAREFLRKGGQRGPQRAILREGTYAINVAQFLVVTETQLYRLALDAHDDQVFARMGQTIAERDGFRPLVIQGTDDLVGIVTVHDGPSLAEGQIIAPIVGEDPAVVATYHNNFQDPECFLAAGGQRGRQLQVLVEGTYYVNRLFATIEMVPKTIIEVGNVGVVVSYTGDVGADISGAEYKDRKSVV